MTTPSDLVTDNLIQSVITALRSDGWQIIPPKIPGSAHAIAGMSPDWTGDEIELLRALWPNLEIKSSDIFARLGRSKGAVKKMAARIGVKRRVLLPKSEPVAKPAPIRLDLGCDAQPTGDDMRFWTEERDAKLRELAKQGCGDPEIAAVLGASCTKNMVIGRRHRLHIELTQCQPGKKRPLMATAGPHKAPKTPKKPKEAPKPKPAPIPAHEVASMPQPALAPIEHLFPALGSAAAILALKPGMCKWPIGDARDDNFHFCGCKALLGLSYCSEHHRASFGIGTLAERKALTAARKVLA